MTEWHTDRPVREPVLYLVFQVYNVNLIRGPKANWFVQGRKKVLIVAEHRGLPSVHETHVPSDLFSPASGSR